MKPLFYLLALLSPLFVEAKKIYIVPIAQLDPSSFFFKPDAHRDGVARPFCALRETLEAQGYEVAFTTNGAGIEDATAVISFDYPNQQLMANLARTPKQKNMLFVFEPPVVIPEYYERWLTDLFGKIFIMFDDLIDWQRYYKFHYPQPYQMILDPVPDFDEKKLSVFVAGNKWSPHPNEIYSERKNLVAYFKSKHPEEFDLYGHGWSPYPAYSIPNKWEVIKNYKFCFCYENMKDQNGYITEKIFDAMVSGTVPIYFGASNIQDYVPADCFIDRRNFASMDELYAFMKNMDRETYASYIRAIDNYFQSPKAQLFSIHHFVQTVMTHLSELE